MRPGTKAWKNFMAKLYGLGASIVIIGALFKIQHWQGAGIMLIIGLGTEAVIFAFSAFEPPHEEVDWSLVYPELAGMHGEEKKELEEAPEEEGLPLTDQLDQMLEQSKIGPDLIESLGSGLRNLGESTAQLNSLTDAGAASNEFVSTMKTATKSAGALSDSYSKATDVISGSSDELAKTYSKVSSSLNQFSATNQESFQEAQTYSQQLQKVSKNLAALNATYELQLQGSNEHMNTTNRLFESTEQLVARINETSAKSGKEGKTYGDQLENINKNLSVLSTAYEAQLKSMKNAGDAYSGIEQLVSTLAQSVNDTKRFKDEMSNLTQSLASLNTIYGNMLTAMNFGKK